MALLTSPTLQNLLTGVRAMLNQPNPLNSFWTDKELTDYINEAVRQYFLECTIANEGYFTTIVDLDVVTDTETIALPNDFFQVKNVWKKVPNGYEILSYSNTMIQSYSTEGGTSSTSYFPSYSFRGNSLVLKPTPNFSETAGIRVEYIQFPDNMIWGGDSLTNQVSPIFKQLIEMYAVYKAKLKESMVNGVTMHLVPKSNVDELYLTFKETIGKRSKNPTFVSTFNP